MTPSEGQIHGTPFSHFMIRQVKARPGTTKGVSPFAGGIISDRGVVQPHRITSAKVLGPFLLSPSKTKPTILLE